MIGTSKLARYKLLGCVVIRPSPPSVGEEWELSNPREGDQPIVPLELSVVVGATRLVAGHMNL